MHLGPILRSLFHNRSRTILAILMTALTLAIVVNCIQMTLAARREMQKLSGFDETNLISLRVQFFDPDFKDDERRAAARREDLRSLRAMPEVVSATPTRLRPWQGGGSSSECRPAESESGFQRMQWYPCDRTIAETLGVEIEEGRAFLESEVEFDSDSLADEGEAREIPVLISAALARLFWPEGALVGRALEFPTGDRATIVGVLDRFYNPYGWPIEEYALFYPGYRDSYESGVNYLVRLTPEAADDVAFVEERLLAGMTGRTVTTNTIPELKRSFFATNSVLVQVLGLIIVLMLAVTSIGVFGMTYFTVSQRTRQIGTRRALGASRGDILRHFLTENWIVTSLGITFGAGLALGLNIVLVHQAGADRLDARYLVLGMLILWIVNFAAALLPAMRGMRVAPAIATRTV